MLTPLTPADSLIDTTLHRPARLWRIVRTDTQVFNFTDHDVAIMFDGVGGGDELYEPTGGVEPSATRHDGSLQAQSLQADGAITSDKITLDDLRNRKWHDAELTEFIVDWMFPMGGAVKTSKYWFTEIEWDGEQWEVTMEGSNRWLKAKRGGCHTRGCPLELGAGFGSVPLVGCGVELDAFTVFGAGVAVATSNVQFTGNTAISGLLTRNRFRFGEVVWTIGANIATRQEIKDYDQIGARVIELFTPTPFPITTSDEFNLRPGCDKIRSTCIDEFDALTFFKGYTFMPGTKRMLLKPRGA